MPGTNKLKAWLEGHGPCGEPVKGRPCWGLKYETGSGYRTYRGTVLKVGREYVTTDLFWNTRFRFESMDKDYLVEADSTGLVQKLFLFEEDKDAYIRRECLAEKFQAGCRKWRQDATERQLEAAMAILDGAPDQACKRIIKMLEQQGGT